MAGHCFIVGAEPSGEWAGHASALAAYTDAGWRFIQPVEGLQAWVKSRSAWATYHGGTWELGALRAERLLIGGVQVIGPPTGAIPDVAGGATIDTEARAAIGAMLTALRGHGLIATE